METNRWIRDCNGDIQHHLLDIIMPELREFARSCRCTSTFWPSLEVEGINVCCCLIDLVNKYMFTEILSFYFNIDNIYPQSLHPVI